MIGKKRGKYTNTEGHKKRYENPEERKNQLAKGNVNIGLKFLSVDLDSAAHYFKKSLAIHLLFRQSILKIIS